MFSRRSGDYTIAYKLMTYNKIIAVLDIDLLPNISVEII